MPLPIAAPPIVIDVEASGFGRGSYPIEIGVAMSDGTTHCFLVRPQPEWTHWDPSAQELHGISRGTLDVHGRPVGEVAQSLNVLLTGTTAYSDAWSYDLAWVHLLFDAAGLVPRFRMEHLRSLMSEGEGGEWNLHRDKVVAELGMSRHRASTDALVIQRTLMRVCYGVCAAELERSS